MIFKYEDFQRPALRDLMSRLDAYRGFHKGEAIRFNKFLDLWDKEVTRADEEMQKHIKDKGNLAEMSKDDLNEMMKPWLETEFTIDMKPFRPSADLKLSPVDLRVGKEILG